MTVSEHLALIDAVIEERLGANAVEEYREAYDHFRGTPLSQLYEIRAQLRAEAATDGTSGSSFRLFEPIDQ